MIYCMFEDYIQPEHYGDKFNKSYSFPLVLLEMSAEKEGNDQWSGVLKGRKNKEKVQHKINLSVKF